MSRAENEDFMDDEDEGSKRPGGLPGWKKALLLVSCVLMAVGLALKGYAYVRGPAEPEAEAPPAAMESAAEPTAPGGARSFLPADAGQGREPERTGETRETEESPPGDRLEDWSMPLFRLGFSFFAGFCIAYALRMFFRISAFAVGLILMALFGLQYAGLIQVDWHAMQTLYDRGVAWLQAQTGGFRQFVLGHLPSAAMAGFGLVVGFKKR